MEDESTAIEQPAESIRDSLSMAFDEEVEVNEPIEIEEAPEEPEIEVQDSEGDVEASESDQSAPDQDIRAPEHWSQSDKDTFNGAPPELRQWLLDRHKSMEGESTKKWQEAADIRKSWQPVEELFAPHMETLRQQGQTPASVISRWAQIDQALTQNPQQTIGWLAKQYNVSVGEGDNDTFVDPHITSLQNQLRDLQNTITQRDTQDSQTRINSAQQAITDFREAKTEAGDLAHPYFDDVYSDLVLLAQTEASQGREPKLDQLYQKAVWANPDVRERMLTSQREAEAKKAEQEAKARAAKAKKAQKTISSSPDGKAASDLSLRDQISQAFE